MVSKRRQPIEGNRKARKQKRRTKKKEGVRRRKRKKRERDRSRCSRGRKGPEMDRESEGKEKEERKRQRKTEQRQDKARKNRGEQIKTKRLRSGLVEATGGIHLLDKIETDKRRLAEREGQMWKQLEAGEERKRQIERRQDR